MLQWGIDPATITMTVRHANHIDIQHVLFTGDGDM